MLNAQEIYNLLLTAYGKPRWWSDDPFVVMLQSVLVQNTTWHSVEKTCAMIDKQLTPKYIIDLPTEELECLIRPCGFYKAKAHTIQALTAWYHQYCFNRRIIEKVPMPQLRNELLSIRGVGAETADVILVYAFYKPSFIIDAYTRRFLLRLGYDFADDATIKRFFETGITEDPQLYGWFHWLILDHCISTCKKTPKCSICLLRSECKQKLSK